MRKRQFGKGKKIYASEHNLAQNYGELNSKEIAVDGSIRGIILGGTLTPHDTLEYTIIAGPTIARTSTGERIVINSLTNIFIKPSVTPGSGNEVYMTAYAEYAYQRTEPDTDEDDIPYYKNYQNSFQISVIQGTIASTGSAIKPSIPSGAVLLCDILYDDTLFASGDIQQSDIDTSRQDRFDVRAFTNLKVNGTTELVGPVTIRSQVDMQGNNFTNIADPINDNQVGDRAYNDNRYVNISGDTMSGKLVVPDLEVTSSMELEDLLINGELIVEGAAAFNDDVNIHGNLAVNEGDASIGGNIQAHSLAIAWEASREYAVGEIVVYDQKVYECLATHTSTSDFYDNITKWVEISGTGGTTHRIRLVGHGFQVGDVLRYDSRIDSRGYTEAKADDPDTIGQFLVIRVLDADNFIISQGGYFEDLTWIIDLVPNQWHYLSDTVAGRLTTEEPRISNPIVYGVTANSGYVIIQRPRVGSSIHTDQFLSSTGQTKFPLTYVPVFKNHVFLDIDGVGQSPDTFEFYSSTGDVVGIELDSGLLGGEDVIIRYIANLVYWPGANLKSDNFTVTITGETTFSLSYSPISKEYIIVTVDGIKQHNSAFNLNGSTLTFTSPLTKGNEIEVIHILNMNAYNPNSSQNSIINGSCRVCQRDETDISGSLQFGKVDRFKISGTYITAGKITVDNSVYGGDNYFLHLKNVSSNNDNASLTLVHRIEHKDAIAHTRKRSSFSMVFAHDIDLIYGISPLDLTVNINVPTVQDDFSSTVTKATKTFTNVDRNALHTLKFENFYVDNCWNGLEIEIIISDIRIFSNKNFYFSRFQLNEGSEAYPFSIKPYEEELSLCQRFLEKSYDVTTVPGTDTLTGIYSQSVSISAGIVSVSNGYILNPINFKVPKRAAPDVTIYSKLGTTNRLSDNAGSDLAANSGIVNSKSENRFDIIQNSGGSISTAFRLMYHWIAEKEL